MAASREGLRGTGVLAVPERGDELAGWERGVVPQASTDPAVGVVAVEARRGGGVGEGEQRRDLGAGRDPVRVVLVAHLARCEDGAQHHRSLAQTRRLERAALQESPLAGSRTREDVGMQQQVSQHPA